MRPALRRFQLTEEAVEDVQFAFPEDAEDFEPFGESVQDLQEEIPNLQQSLVPGGCS